MGAFVSKAYYQNPITGEIRIYDSIADSIPSTWRLVDSLPAPAPAELGTQVTPAGDNQTPTYRVESVVVLWLPYFVLILFVFAFVIWQGGRE